MLPALAMVEVDMLIQKLTDEHRQILKTLEEVKLRSSAMIKEFRPYLVNEIENALQNLQAQMSAHHQLEEKVLFPKLFNSGEIFPGGPRCTHFMGLKLLEEPNDDRQREFKSAIEQSPLGIPINEHRIAAGYLEEIFKILNELKSANFVGEDLIKLKIMIDKYDQLLKNHIEKEETCLFVMAKTILESPSASHKHLIA